MNTEKNIQPCGFEKFREFAKQIISVPKSEIDRREKEYKKASKQRAKKKGL
jgi:hypothetical protein